MENFSSATQNWYANLMDKCNEMTERFGLNDEHSAEMKGFIYETAKTQYQIGNKCGARWAFKKQQTGASQSTAAVAA
ncbi:TPA: hypothetical protein DEA21_01160 [Candidatus Uhrbacteria bacterium]|nr:hypothetical protein [Candidatus Uhrbacteria bacterium]HCU32012.1 hypothetical protein [Candidatus Uhrbacteria bacterium]